MNGLVQSDKMPAFISPGLNHMSAVEVGNHGSDKAWASAPYRLRSLLHRWANLIRVIQHAPHFLFSAERKKGFAEQRTLLSITTFAWRDMPRLPHSIGKHLLLLKVFHGKAVSCCMLETRRNELIWLTIINRNGATCCSESWPSYQSLLDVRF